MKFILLLLLFLSCSNDSPNIGISSNPNFIKGTVFNKSGEVQANAKVTLYSIRNEFVIAIDSTITSDNGEYSFTDVDYAYIEVKKDILISFTGRDESSSAIFIDSSVNYHGFVDIETLDSTSEYSVLLSKTPYIVKLNSDQTFDFTNIPQGHFTLLVIDNDSSVITSSEVDIDENLLKVDTLNTDTLIFGIKKADELLQDTVKVVLDSSTFDDSYIVEEVTYLNNLLLQNLNYGMYSSLNIGIEDTFKYQSLFKINDLTLGSVVNLEDFNSKYTKVELILSIREKTILNSEDSLEVFYINTAWKEGSGLEENQSETVDGVTSVDRYYGEKWSAENISKDGIDASETSVINEKISNCINGDYVTIDITQMYRKWLSNEIQNNGFLICLKSADETSSSFIVLNSVESSSKPFLKFY